MKTVRKNLAIFFAIKLLILSVFMTGCIEQTSSDGAMDVIVTVIPQVEMVETIGGDYVDVTDGLKNGETVVTSGVFKLRSGSQVVIDNTLAPKASLEPNPKDS